MLAPLLYSSQRPHVRSEISSLHGDRRQPMCDPEGCATVLGAVGGGDPQPPPWLTQTLGVGGSGGQPPGSPGGGGVGGHPNIHLKMIPMTR